MRLIRFLITVTMASVLLASGIMCVRMVQRQPVAMPALWVGGLILSLLYLVWVLSRFDLCERYAMKQFEANWIKDRAKQKGFHYHDKPGCYVILIYRFHNLLPFAAGRTGVYVGQSLEVYRRIHSHLNRKGNGDVYADARQGRYIEIEVYPCRPQKLNAMERKLIRKYHAESSYNRTSGGGTKRGLFDGTGH